MEETKKTQETEIPRLHLGLSAPDVSDEAAPLRGVSRACGGRGGLGLGAGLWLLDGGAREVADGRTHPAPELL